MVHVKSSLKVELLAAAGFPQLALRRFQPECRTRRMNSLRQISKQFSSLANTRKPASQAVSATWKSGGEPLPRKGLSAKDCRPTDKSGPTRFIRETAGCAVRTIRVIGAHGA
jgi:hypothetical protein